MNRVFVNTNIILDLLSRREPFYPAAAKLFSEADRGKLRIYVSSLSFATIYYIVAKNTSPAKARQIIGQFKVLVHVLSVDDKIIELALSSPFSDFEDAIQYYAAIENNINILLTRNIKDYKKSEIPIMSVEDFLSRSI